jgi:hypothetical protein
MLVVAVATAQAQRINFETHMQEDDVPSTIFSTLMGYENGSKDSVDYRFMYIGSYAHQRTRGGSAELFAELHGIRSDLRLGRSDATFLQIGAGGLLFSERGIVPSMTLHMAFKDSVIEMWGRPLTYTIRAEADRDADRLLTAALFESTMFWSTAGQIDMDLGGWATATIRGQRRWYDDQNTVDMAFGYILLQPLRTDAISLGYSYAYANSRFTVWNHVGSVLDPETRTYRYTYAYNPYFTPLQERGHSIIGIVRGAIGEDVYFYGQATIPLSTVGQLTWRPETGTTPEPEDVVVGYDVEDILPLQVDVAAATTIIPRLLFTVGIHYFNKPYYEAVTVRLKASYQL